METTFSVVQCPKQNKSKSFKQTQDVEKFKPNAEPASQKVDYEVVVMIKSQNPVIRDISSEN